MDHWVYRRARCICSSQVAASAWFTLASAVPAILPQSSSKIIAHRALFAGASSTHPTRMSPEEWKRVYRAFLFHVHPDFFHDQPKERANNEKNLKMFQQHLQHLEEHDGQNRNINQTGVNEVKRLVFFLKPPTEPKVHSPGTEDDPNDSAHGNSDEKEKVDDHHDQPQKVLLPLQDHINMAHLLHEAGIRATRTTTSTSPLPSSPTTDHSSSGDIPEWEDWADDLFSGTAANRAWDEAEKRRKRSARQFGEQNGGTGEGRQNRTTEGGAASEEYHHYGAERLGHVLATDAGRALVRERRASARTVEKLVGQLRKQYGFGKFNFRCGWSKANLCTALWSLLETCDTHRSAFRVPDFGGLEVVFRNDPSVVHKGEIRLSPADVPLRWISVLQGVTPKLLSEVEERSREMLALESEASTILRGARLSRGLSCSKSKYFTFLSRVCMSGADRGVRDLMKDASFGDWSVLHCRVEEGFSRASKVLEDGTVQIGSDMTLQTLQECLAKDFATSSAIAANSAQLAAAVQAASTRCRQCLGLGNIDRGRAVSLAQMVAACDALVRFSETESGDMESEAVDARRRLRGQFVRVVATRLGVFDGVTEDGEIAVPWNWAEEEERSGRAAWGSRRSPSSLFD